MGGMTVSLNHPLHSERAAVGCRGENEVREQTQDKNAEKE